MNFGVVLVALLVGFAPADRIDFFSGKGSFVLTPYLCLSVIFLVYKVLSLRIAKRFSPNTEGLYLYATSIGVLLMLIFLGAVFSADVDLTFKKLCLLFILIATSQIAVFFHTSAEDVRLAFKWGSILGILIYTIFSVIQLIVWFGTGSFSSDLTVTSTFNFFPGSLGTFAPRITGFVVDPNRGGFSLLIYIYILNKFGERSWISSSCVAIASILLVLTLSKSAVIAAMFSYLFYYLFLGGNRRRSPLVQSPTVITYVSVALLLALLSYFYLPDDSSWAAVVSTVLDTSSDSSASSHVELIYLGLHLVSNSARIFVVGHGLGASGSLLYEFFQDSKYANFHSLYVTLLVECGFFSLLVTLVILCTPVVRLNTLSPLLFGFIVFNVFYQTLYEPIFWMTIALAYSEIFVRRVLPSR